MRISVRQRNFAFLAAGIALAIPLRAQAVVATEACHLGSILLPASGKQRPERPPFPGAAPKLEADSLPRWLGQDYAVIVPKRGTRRPFLAEHATLVEGDLVVGFAAGEEKFAPSPELKKKKRAVTATSNQFPSSDFDAVPVKDYVARQDADPALLWRIKQEKEAFEHPTSEQEADLRFRLERAKRWASGNIQRQEDIAALEHDPHLSAALSKIEDMPGKGPYTNAEKEKIIRVLVENAGVDESTARFLVYSGVIGKNGRRSMPKARRSSLMAGDLVLVRLCDGKTFPARLIRAGARSHAQGADGGKWSFRALDETQAVGGAAQDYPPAEVAAVVAAKDLFTLEGWNDPANQEIVNGYQEYDQLGKRFERARRRQRSRLQAEKEGADARKIASLEEGALAEGRVLDAIEADIKAHPDKAKAIEAAHAEGRFSGTGSYSVAELKRKMNILKDAGFSDDECAALIRSGIAGDAHRQADVAERPVYSDLNMWARAATGGVEPPRTGNNPTVFFAKRADVKFEGASAFSGYGYEIKDEQLWVYTDAQREGKQKIGNAEDWSIAPYEKIADHKKYLEKRSSEPSYKEELDRWAADLESKNKERAAGQRRDSRPSPALVEWAREQSKARDAASPGFLSDDILPYAFIPKEASGGGKTETGYGYQIRGGDIFVFTDAEQSRGKMRSIGKASDWSIVDEKMLRDERERLAEGGQSEGLDEFREMEEILSEMRRERLHARLKPHKAAEKAHAERQRKHREEAPRKMRARITDKALAAFRKKHWKKRPGLYQENPAEYREMDAPVVLLHDGQLRLGRRVVSKTVGQAISRTVEDGRVASETLNQGRKFFYVETETGLIPLLPTSQSMKVFDAGFFFTQGEIPYSYDLLNQYMKLMGEDDPATFLDLAGRAMEERKDAEVSALRAKGASEEAKEIAMLKHHVYAEVTVNGHTEIVSIEKYDSKKHVVKMMSFARGNGDGLMPAGVNDYPLNDFSKARFLSPEEAAPYYVALEESIMFRTTSQRIVDGVKRRRLEQQKQEESPPEQPAQVPVRPDQTAQIAVPLPKKEPKPARTVVKAESALEPVVVEFEDGNVVLARAARKLSDGDWELEFSSPSGATLKVEHPAAKVRALKIARDFFTKAAWDAPENAGLRAAYQKMDSLQNRFNAYKKNGDARRIERRNKRTFDARKAAAKAGADPVKIAEEMRKRERIEEEQADAELDLIKQIESKAASNPMYGRVIDRAHEVGRFGEPGKPYTSEELKKKVEILQQIFNKREYEALLRSGIAGDGHRGPGGGPPPTVIIGGYEYPTLIAHPVVVIPVDGSQPFLSTRAELFSERDAQGANAYGYDFLEHDPNLRLQGTVILEKRRYRFGQFTWGDLNDPSIQADPRFSKLRKTLNAERSIYGWADHLTDGNSPPPNGKTQPYALFAKKPEAMGAQQRIEQCYGYEIQNGNIWVFQDPLQRQKKFIGSVSEWSIVSESDLQRRKDHLLEGQRSEESKEYDFQINKLRKMREELGAAHAERQRGERGGGAGPRQDADLHPAPSLRAELEPAPNVEAVRRLAQAQNVKPGDYRPMGQPVVVVDADGHVFLRRRVIATQYKDKTFYIAEPSSRPDKPIALAADSGMTVFDARMFFESGEVPYSYDLLNQYGHDTATLSPALLNMAGQAMLARAKGGSGSRFKDGIYVAFQFSGSGERKEGLAVLTGYDPAHQTFTGETLVRTESGVERHPFVRPFGAQEFPSVRFLGPGEMEPLYAPLKAAEPPLAPRAKFPEEAPPTTVAKPPQMDPAQGEGERGHVQTANLSARENVRTGRLYSGEMNGVGAKTAERAPAKTDQCRRPAYDAQGNSIVQTISNAGDEANISYESPSAAGRRIGGYIEDYRLNEKGELVDVQIHRWDGLKYAEPVWLGLLKDKSELASFKKTWRSSATNLEALRKEPFYRHRR